MIKYIKMTSIISRETNNKTPRNKGRNLISF